MLRQCADNVPEDRWQFASCQNDRLSPFEIGHCDDAAFAIIDHIRLTVGQPRWEAVVRFTGNAPVTAYELGVMQANVDEQRSLQSPRTWSRYFVDFGLTTGPKIGKP